MVYDKAGLQHFGPTATYKLKIDEGCVPGANPIL